MHVLADQLTRSRYWPSGLLPSCYVKRYVCHAFPAINHRHSLSFAVLLAKPRMCLRYPPFGCLPLFCQMKYYLLLRAVCHAHTAIGHCHWLPFWSSDTILFTFKRQYSASHCWLITACIPAISLLAIFFPAIFHAKCYYAICMSHWPAPTVL